MEEGVGDHRHQRVSMQSRPGSTFEVVGPKLLRELLMGLFTDPPGLDRGSERLDGGIGRQVRYIVFLFLGRPPLADEPDLVTRHALHTVIGHSVLVAIRNADTAGREAACQPISLVPRRQLTLAICLRPITLQQRPLADRGRSICGAIPVAGAGRRSSWRTSKLGPICSDRRADSA